MRDTKLEYKFRILINGERVFGEGPCRLLENVEKQASLKKACEDLNMSYSKGWGIIKKAEKTLNYKLLESQAGGKEGGGSYLTKEAKTLVKTYRSFEKESGENLEELFNKYFKEI